MNKKLIIGVICIFLCLSMLSAGYGEWYVGMDKNLSDVSLEELYPTYPSYPNYPFSQEDFDAIKLVKGESWQWYHAIYNDFEKEQNNILWNDPRSYDERDYEFKLLAEDIYIAYFAEKVHKLTILNNGLISDIKKDVDKLMSENEKKIISEGEFYITNYTFQIFDLNKENPAKLISSDRLYYSGKPMDLQGETILLKNIMSDSGIFRFVNNKFKTFLEINEEGIKSSGKICDINGCIGDSKESSEVPAGVWCGLCGDETLNIEPCNGYNVCESCPEGYTRKSYSNMMYMDSKAMLEGVMTNPKNDYICVKN